GDVSRRSIRSGGGSTRSFRRSGETLHDRSRRRHRDRCRDEHDTVLARELWTPRDIDRDDRPAGGAQLRLERAAIGAERVRELDDDLAAGTRCTELREID